MKKFRLYPIYLLLIMIAFSSCKQSDGQFLKKIQNNGIDLPVGVKMTVLNKVVYLDGIVESDSIIQAIESNLKLVKGVQGVENNLQNVPSSMELANVALEDNLLQSRILSVLYAYGLDKVQLEVLNGKVKVKGRVSSNESFKVLNIVNSFGPVSVLNEMVVVYR